MRIIAIAGITAVVAAATVGGVTAAQAGTPSHRHPSDQRFTVVERAITDTTADTGPAGDSLGDVLAFANPIYNAANTTKLGSDNGSCVRTKVGAAYDCTWTLTLAGGQLMVSGPFYDTADSLLAITGGTGKWVGARGQMKLHARDKAGSAYDFSYDVLR